MSFIAPLKVIASIRKELPNKSTPSIGILNLLLLGRLVTLLFLEFARKLGRVTSWWLWSISIGIGLFSKTAEELVLLEEEFWTTLTLSLPWNILELLLAAVLEPWLTPETPNWNLDLTDILTHKLPACLKSEIGKIMGSINI